MFYLSWDFLRAVFGYSQFWKRRSLAFRGKPRITSQIIGLGSVSRDAYYTPEGIKFQNWERKKKNTISLSKKPWRTCVCAGNIIQHIPVLGLSFFLLLLCVKRTDGPGFFVPSCFCILCRSKDRYEEHSKRIKREDLCWASWKRR